MEVEDDVFFAELNRQISLLIMDEEDTNAHYPSVSVHQAFPRAIHAAAPQSPFSYNQQACRRESKGTGVFIPQSSHPRGKINRQARSFSSSNTKSQNHSNNKRWLPQPSYPNNLSHNYFKPM